MAESAKETRKGRRAAANYTEDSVEAEFGGDYSEASLEVIRQLGRKGAQFAQVEPWEEEAVQPSPQEECDAAVEELKSLERALDAVKQYVPNSKELEWIDYKRALVEDASDDEITWLKLKAYYHGMDVLRASSQAVDAPAGGDAGDGATAASHRTEDAAATPASALSTDMDAARESVLQAVRAFLPSSSSDEEDTGALLQSASSRRVGSLAPAVTSRAAAAAAVNTAAAPTAAAATGTIYHPDYLEEIRLETQLAQQRKQRSSAFVLGLAAAVSLSVVRWWVRRKRQGNGGGAATAARRPTPLLPISQ